MIPRESPDMIIFRTYDSEGGLDSHLFVQLLFDEDGNLEKTGKLFTVAEGDGYRELDYDQIIFATETEDGHGSIQLGSFTISNSETEDRVAIFTVDYEDLNNIVAGLLETYHDGVKPTYLS